MEDHDTAVKVEPAAQDTTAAADSWPVAALVQAAQSTASNADPSLVDALIHLTGRVLAT
jgi:hypothetical protein